jgi:SAM-dependent methyltransferase
VATTDAHGHWQRIWTAKAPDEVSWFEPLPRVSVAMIESLELPPDAPIIDVGGGASGLAGELLALGYRDVTVADISERALARAREALGARADMVDWVVADVRAADFGRRFRLWHDRAVFHFLVDEADRQRYLDVASRSLATGGHLIIATFGPDAPPTCSGLPVQRYAADELAEVFAPVAELVSDRLELHRTPRGKEQQFLYAGLRARAPGNTSM